MTGNSARKITKKRRGATPPRALPPIAEELSFTRAARRVHIVQSALAVSVRSLERELGARLIDRSTHHVELTDAGKALVVEARRTLLAAEAARDAVAATVGGIRGTLRLGIRHSLALVDLAGC